MLAVTNAPQNLREPLLKTLGAAFMRLMRCHEASKKVRRCRTLADLLDAAHGALVDALSFDRSDASKLSATVHQVCPMQADGSGAPGDELLDLGDFCFMEARRLPFVEPALEARDTLLWSEREIEEVASDVGCTSCGRWRAPAGRGRRRRGRASPRRSGGAPTRRAAMSTRREPALRMETRLATGSVPKETSVLASAASSTARRRWWRRRQPGRRAVLDDRLIMTSRPRKSRQRSRRSASPSRSPSSCASRSTSPTTRRR